MNEIYYVEHLYEYQNLDEDKPLGFFSTLENAKRCIDFYKKLEGFNRYLKNFFIHKMRIDQINWSEGFIKGFDIPAWALKYPPHQNETPLCIQKESVILSIERIATLAKEVASLENLLLR